MAKIFVCPTSKKDDSQSSIQYEWFIGADDIFLARECMLEHIKTNSDDNYIYHIEDITTNDECKKYEEIFNGIHRLMGFENG